MRSLIYIGFIDFTVGIVDVYFDYDKWSVLWLASGIFFTMIGLSGWIIDEIRKVKK